MSFPTLDVKEPGIIFVYLSYDNDSNNWVYFDDLKITHTKTSVVQYSEYYPFGHQTSSSWTRENNTNNFLYNGASELNKTSAWYETFFRNYDPLLGRFHQIDPLSNALSSTSPYNYGINNPVTYNDPNGDYIQPTMAPERPPESGTMASIMTSGGINGFDNYVNYIFGGPAIPTYSFAVTPGAFLNSAKYSRYGGTWSSGEGGRLFESDEEAFFSGMGYNNYHNSWAHTEYGNAPSSLAAFGVIRESRKIPTKDEVQNIIDPSRLNVYASTSSANYEDPWYLIAWKSYTNYLRTERMFGTLFNPFYMAETIYSDIGGGIGGFEGDKGFFLVLAGNQAGQFFSYNEHVTWGVGTDIAPAQAELGRIDYTGKIADFNSGFLYGPRHKVTVGSVPLQYNFSISASGSWYMQTNEEYIIGVSINISWGRAVFKFGGSYNYGKIE